MTVKMPWRAKKSHVRPTGYYLVPGTGYACARPTDSAQRPNGPPCYVPTIVQGTGIIPGYH